MRLAFTQAQQDRNRTMGEALAAPALLASLPAPVVHLPFEAGEYRMTMGLLARDPDEFIVIDDRYPHEMAQRRVLFAERRDEVLAALPEAEDACTELLETLAELLPRRFPAWFAHEGARLSNRLTGESWTPGARGLAALEIAGRLVQEDLCLLQLRDGVPHLTAGVLCFPAGWRLLEKLDLPLAAVHGPVPIYPERLARPVDRLIATLKDGRMVERVNWSVLDTDALYRPRGHNLRKRNANVTAANAGESMFLRVERQTLRRLPRSGAVVFGIRTYVYPIGMIASDPAVAARLAAAVRGLPEELANYKSVGVVREPLLEYLDRQTAGSAEA
jgi:hypothetical protein